VANPSLATAIAVGYLVVGLIWAGIGALAWAEEDASDGLWRLALGGCFLVLAVLVRRGRQGDNSK
jgi:hypothetical protein